VIISHNDSKGRAIRHGPYFLEVVSVAQDHPRSVDSRGLMSTKFSQEKSATLGARSASSRACHTNKTKKGEWHPWSMLCFLKDTS
jgi:hypothetical protein